MILVRYSIKGRVQETQTRLPFWAGHAGTGSLAAEAICRSIFDANDKWIGKQSTVEVTIHSPEGIAGTYDVRLERALNVNATRRAA